MGFENVWEAVFLKRRNRFIAEVEIDGRIEAAHVANTGRMAELLLPGVPALVRRAENQNRKTAWDLLAVKKDGRWVCLQARWANDFFAAWLAEKRIAGFENATTIRKEYKIGGSRFDFMIECEGEKWLIEVKSVNFVTAGHALFPDAPTERGRRHVEELLSLRSEGYKVGVVFVTMGQDVVDVSFNEKNDPAFAAAMRRALDEKIYVHAFSARIEPPQVLFNGERPII